MTCLHCNAEVTNGLALCELCQRYAESILEHLPLYAANLARWRPGRAGSRPVPGSRVLYDGVDHGDSTGDRISDRLDEAMTALTTWARALSDDRPDSEMPYTYPDAVLHGYLSEATAEHLGDHPAEVARLLCEAFKGHLTSIATLGWCGDFVSNLAHHEQVLRKLTETAVPGWYAGGCRQVLGFDDEGAAIRCGADVYVTPGLSWAACGSCHATTHATDHLENVLHEARDWVGRPKRMAEVIVALVASEQSVPRLYARIRKWASDGEIKSVRRTERGYVWSDEADRIVVADQEVGLPRYQLGEVLDLVLRPTRSLSSERAS